ncbi:MAG: hypothetical protein IPJ77_20140 [Planctomycetes bacterium]|nr:hypothetical protein [Planctomycetota bacterium]
MTFRARLLSLAVLLLASACWSSGVRSIPDTQSRYDHLPAPVGRALRDARADFDAGRFEEARIALQLLAEERPDSIVLGAWLQEAEIALATTSVASTPTPGAPDELARRYARAAEESPTVARLVLAARVAADDDAARALLDRAAELDPRCAWVPYARAFLAAKKANWEEVRRALAKAEEFDPGHLPTRWFESWMLARGGRVREAIQSFETWTAKAEGDPRVDGRLLLGARLDLALLYVLDENPRRAEALLAELGGATDGAAREHLIRSAVAQADGDPRAALAEAERASQLAPGDVLPVVQQALLNELWLGDEAAAEVAWTKVLALSRSAPDLSSMLERVRARVRLERHQRARATPPPESKP